MAAAPSTTIDDFDARSAPAIPGYRILARLAEGGMSEVYLARQEGGAPRAVLKVLPVRRADGADLWERFFQECAMLSSIEHANVVRVYGHGWAGDMAYLAMEYLEGGTLAGLAGAPLPEPRALSLLAQAARGLAEVHRHGIVHRDIKPANLMFRHGGELVLTDFGIAHRIGRAGRTLQGEILGTPYYLSPEQALGLPVSPSADLYGLGVVFFEILTGRRPFPGESVSEAIAQHLSAPVPRLPPECRACQGLIDGLLAKSPAGRFRDADTLLAEIGRVRPGTRCSA